jgi:hypothetical protein
MTAAEIAMSVGRPQQPRVSSASGNSASATTAFHASTPAASMVHKATARRGDGCAPIPPAVRLACRSGMSDREGDGDFDSDGDAGDAAGNVEHGGVEPGDEGAKADDAVVAQKKNVVLAELPLVLPTANKKRATLLVEIDSAGFDLAGICRVDS